jgi:thiosulfate/3-mercaptopyruvate sulfurtransferase
MPALDLTDRHLVDAKWLVDHVQDPQLRIIDATVILDPASWEANSGRAGWEAGHVPNSRFADLIEEFSDPAGDEGLPSGVHAYRVPSADAFASAISAHGVGPDTAVVVYDTSAGMWASRLWWLLRYYGHENVAVLDGGWSAWLDAGGPVSTEVVSAPRARFVARPNPALLVTTEQVASSIGTEDAPVLVNALWPELFRGETEGPLPRPGRIPGSVNVPFTDTVDHRGLMLAPDRLRAVFAEAGVSSDREVVTYCGGGIAASFDALALATVGIDAALYDGSLVEWVADESLPMETG